MKYFWYLNLLLFILFFTSCSKNKDSQSEFAHLRIVEMISNADVSVSFHPKNKNQGNKSFIAISEGYRMYEPGFYLLTLKTGGDAIYKRTYVLGKNAHYTLVITGLVAEKPQIATDTWQYSVSHIFAGGEARVKNNYLPISFMLYNSFHGNGKQALIRVTNTAPNAPKITVKSDDKTIVESLSYPKTGKIIHAEPGSKILKVYYGDIEMGAKTIQTKGGYLYDIFIGNGVRNGYQLKIIVRKTRLMHKN